MHIRLLLAFVLMLRMAAPGPAASLTLLPDWLGSAAIRNVWMLPDGATVTGVDGTDVFRWSAAIGRTNVGVLPSTIQSQPAGLLAASEDGNTIIGYIGNNQSKPSGGFIWTLAGGTMIMPPLPNDPLLHAAPIAVSGDGSVVAGNTYYSFYNEHRAAFRWTAATGYEELPGIEYPDAISADGSTTGGVGPFGTSGTQAVRWTRSTGGVGLGLLPNSWQEVSDVDSISADGSAIVGYGFPPDARIGAKIFRWTEGDGMQQLSTLGDDQEVLAVSGDANVIVGRMRTLIPDASYFATTNELFIWTPATGLEKFSVILSSLGLDAVLPLTDSTKFQDIIDLSANGRIAFGRSSRQIPSGNPYMPIIANEYWLLDMSPVPEPPSCALVFIMLCSLLATYSRSCTWLRCSDNM